MNGLDRSVLTIRPTADVTVSNPYVGQVLANATAASLTVRLVTRTGRMEHKVSVQKTDNSANTVTVIAGTITAILSSENDALVFDQDDLGVWHIFSGSLAPAVGGLTYETPTGAVNGVNAIFVFTAPPVLVTFQGVVQTAGVDYTLTVNTVTFTVPPVGGTVQGLVIS